MYNFIKDINSIWNAKSLVQDLNSGHYIHVLQR